MLNKDRKTLKPEMMINLKGTRMEKINTDYKQRNQKFRLNFSNRLTVTWLLKACKK